MSKELIERLYDEAQDNTESLEWKAADALEAQQSWIDSLEQNARDADRMYKELETELAEAQKRIDDMNSLCAFNERTMDEMLARLAAAQAREKVLRDALENCRLFAARRRAEEWATHILRFCESGGSVANPLRQDDSALRELLKAEREKCAKVIERLISGDGICADDGVWIHDCAEAIRAMEDQ